MAFQKAKRAPGEIWVDVPKWGGKLLALVTLHFGTTHTRIGQDWRHFEELLIANLDRQHGQYYDVRRGGESPGAGEEH